jgi:hypothetical protein
VSRQQAAKSPIKYQSTVLNLATVLHYGLDLTVETASKIMEAPLGPLAISNTEKIPSQELASITFDYQDVCRCTSNNIATSVGSQEVSLSAYQRLDTRAEAQN